jgi:hypothetical protein
MFLPTNITLKFGDSGDFVTELQRRLSVISCFNPDAINGFFDGSTVNGVSQFQTQSGIRADGIAGPETLRRLNGAISGDYTSGNAADSKAEEEARLRQEQATRLLIEQQMLADQQRQAELERQLAAQAIQAPVAATIAPAMLDAQAYAAAPQAYTQPQVYAAQPAPQQPIAPVAQAPSAGDMLAQMLLAQQAAQPAPQPQSYAQPAPPAQPAPVAYQASPAAPYQPAPHPAAQAYAPPAAAQTQQAQPYAPAAAATPQAYGAPAEPASPAAQQPRGIVGKAMQYANDVVQKIANYIESKLPQHTLNEVKEIGATLARSGVREVPIAGGQSQEQERAVDQGRGQGQGVQRG